MKIGIDARTLLPPRTGVGEYLYNLLRYYSRLDSRNEYILYFNQAAEIDFSHFSRRILKIPLLNQNVFWSNLRLPIDLLLNKVDLFHSPFYVLPLIQPCKTVVTIHDISYEAHPEWFRWGNRLSFQIFSRWAARTARMIITDSESSKRELMKYYGLSERKIRVILIAANEIFKPLSDKSLLSKVKSKYNIKRPFILFTGQIHIRRNVERLITAFKKLKTQKKIDHQLVLVGQNIWPFLDLKELIDQQGLNGEVIYLDYIPQADLVALYNAAEVFVYPSLYEGFGLPPLEAMACGTPVISSNVSSIPEVVGDAGVLINPYNADEIAEAIWSLIADSELRTKLVQRGLERAKQFSWEKAARETLKVYEEIA